MTQTEKVVNAMREHGGYATLGELNYLVDVSQWKSKTPFASIRRIVQLGPFFRIQPGLWALKDSRDEVLKKFGIQDAKPEKVDTFTHSYYQGLLVEIGNMNKYLTYVPAQDKNRKFLETRLIDIASTTSIFPFSNTSFVKRATSVDVIWFNERRMPSSLFEVEHSTDIQNSLLKFCDLQDFSVKFYIVADESRRHQFNDIIERNTYDDIRKRVEFFNYNSLSLQYEKLKEYLAIPHLT